MPLFQGQEPCSGLKNFHASGWFFNSAPQPSTSQIYCGHRTLIMKKCKSQIIIHKVHSLMCRCFLMGTMGDQPPGVWLFVTPWTVACQAPLYMGILQARILEWVAISSSRRFSQPRDQTQVSCVAGGFFTIWATGKPLGKDRWTGNLHSPTCSQYQHLFPTFFWSLKTIWYSS